MTLYETVTLVNVLDTGVSHFWSNFSAIGIYGGPVFLRVVRIFPISTLQSERILREQWETWFVLLIVIKSRRIRLAGHVVRMGEKREGLDRMLLQWVFKK
jgi:hypothetical protein